MRWLSLRKFVYCLTKILLMAYQTSHYIYTTVCTCQIVVERESFIFVGICETVGSMEEKPNTFFSFSTLFGRERNCS